MLDHKRGGEDCEVKVGDEVFSDDGMTGEVIQFLNETEEVLYDPCGAYSALVKWSDGTFSWFWLDEMKPHLPN